MGAFHYGKTLRKFWSKLNGSFWLGQTGIIRNIPSCSLLLVELRSRTEICCSILTNRFVSLFLFSKLSREFGKGIKTYTWKYPSIFSRIFPLVSCRSAWHDGSTPYVMEDSGRIVAGRNWNWTEIKNKKRIYKSDCEQNDINHKTNLVWWQRNWSSLA